MPRPTVKMLFLQMDKPAADLAASLDSVVDRLKAEPLLVQLPLGEGRDLRGVVDLTDLTSITWNPEQAEDQWGLSFARSPSEGSLREEAASMRANLIDRLCERDDALADELLAGESYESISPATLKAALRKATFRNGDADSSARQLVTLAGSAYRNIGVQMLMDAVVDYLPSPAEIAPSELAFHQPSTFCGLAFKAIHEPRLGLLTFVRVYRGSVKEGDQLYNMSKERSERVGKLLVAFADEFKAVKEVTEGNIAVVCGLKETYTGDTLVANANAAKSAVANSEKKSGKGGGASPFLAGLTVPEPVFYCSIEPPSMMYQLSLEKALANLAREDPSLGVRSDAETGQTVLSGMGELHLEIVADRIRKEYKVDVDLGQLLIAYREAPTDTGREEVVYSRAMAGRNHTVTVEVSVEPENMMLDEGQSKRQKLILSKHQDEREALEELRWSMLKEANHGLETALAAGPILDCPVVGARFTLNKFQAARSTPGPLLSAATAEACRAALKKAGARLLEPVMALEVTAEPEAASDVQHDLVNRRRAEILSADERGGLVVLRATAPLSTLRGYSSFVRALTSGRATFGMHLQRYVAMDDTESNKAIEEVTGFAPAASS